MKLFLSAAALCILLTPALAQQADQPVADQTQQAPVADIQPAAAEQPGMTQAAAQLAAQAAAQADEEQGSSAAPPAMEQAPAAAQAPADMQAPETQQDSQQDSQQAGDPTAYPNDGSRPSDATAAQPPYIAQPPEQRPVRRRALDVPPAIRPRSEAAAYSAYRQQQQFSVGARLLSSREVEQKFSTPLNKRYLVVEVGFFPAGSQPIQLRPQDFTLRIGSDDQAFFPSTPEDIASALSGSGQRNPRFYPSVGIGYGGGGWGRGVSTGAGVGVGGPYPRRGDMAGGNRRVMEDELRDKSLPATTLTQPAAGYLYFLLSGKRSAAYNLEVTRNGVTTSLALPNPNK